MFSFLHNLRLASRIVLAVIFPVMGMLIFSGAGLFEKYDKLRNVEQLEALASLGSDTGNLVHVLQKERGMSVGFVASKGASFAQPLPAQRRDVDACLAALLTRFTAWEDVPQEAELKAVIGAARKNLDMLTATRAKVDSLSLSPAETAGFYTATIARLLAVVERMAVADTDVRLSKAITAYMQFLQGKERAGQERATASGGFAAKHFDPDSYRRFAQLIAQQESYFATFLIYATDEEKAALRAVQTDPVAQDVDRMRQIAMDSPFTGNTGNVEAPHWFDTITRKIELMKGVEDKAAATLITIARAVHAETQTALFTYAAATAALLLLAIGTAAAIALGITRPLGKIIHAIGVLSKGDLTHRVDVGTRHDEIGTVADALEVFRTGLLRAEELTREQQAQQAARDARARIVDEILVTFNADVVEVLETMASASTELEATSQAMSATASMTSGKATAVSSAVEEVAASMRTVAGAAEELSAAEGAITGMVSDSVRITDNARRCAQQTNEKVQQLSDTSSRIGEVVGLINQIAGQTNLLALNATIEAARAGEAGRGFAVVASEVKQLASQTARATGEISDQITAVQESTEFVVSAIREITSIIERMSELSAGVSHSVSEQMVATSQIAAAAQQIVAAVDDVGANVVHVNQAADETGHAASDVMAAAHVTAERATFLRAQVDTFFTRIRAA